MWVEAALLLQKSLLRFVKMGGLYCPILGNVDGVEIIGIDCPIYVSVLLEL